MKLRDCWCGNGALDEYSPDYALCRECGTLVSRFGLSDEETLVKDESRDFYGEKYWFKHLTGSFGYPEFEQRMRSDLAERCLHWLRCALKYKTPNGKALELGSGHGGFVAMLRHAGFDATGLEMSSTIVAISRRSFGIPVLLGPIEEHDVAAQSLDLIALMDVLEHLPDPVATMRHCLSLLCPAGIFVIQTPRFPEDVTYAQLVARGDRFIEQLKRDEHLYLFSERAIRRFFQQIGARHINFEPAIFAHYDMALVASREPLSEIETRATEDALNSSPTGRITLALLDIDDANRKSHVARLQCAQALEATALELTKSEEDRAARLAVIEEQGKALSRIPELEADVARLAKQLAVSESDRAARLAVIEEQGKSLSRIPELEADVARLAKQLAVSESDRAARLAVIEEQGKSLSRIPELEADVARLAKQLAVSESDRAARLAVIEKQGKSLSRIPELEADVARLAKQLAVSESDRAARLKVLQEQGSRLDRMPALEAEVTRLTKQLAISESDRAARLKVIHEQGGRLDRIPALEADIARLATKLAESESDRAARLEVIHEQGGRLDRIPSLEADIARLATHLAASESDRAARLEIIQKQEHQLKLIPKLQSEIKELEGRLVVSEDNVAQITAQLSQLAFLPKPLRWLIQKLQPALYSGSATSKPD